MKDFNIAKYLKEHNLGSYGKFNHYVDLKPLKEAEDNAMYITPEEAEERAKQIAPRVTSVEIEGEYPDTFIVSGRYKEENGEFRDLTPDELDSLNDSHSTRLDLVDRKRLYLEDNLTGMGGGDSFKQAGAGAFEVEIDWNGDRSPKLPNLKGEAKKFNLSVQLIDFEGPAGGAAEVRLTGTRENLINFITQVYSPGDELHQQDMIDSIKQAGSSTLEIDWNGSIPTLTKKAQRFNLSVEVKEEYGPAGGAMVVELTGTRENLINFVKQVYSPGDELHQQDMIDAIQ